MSTKFFTNKDSNTLLKKLEGVFEHNHDIEYFDALVGYFRASGYFAVRPFLAHVPNIRVLVGINVDSLIANYQRQGMLYLADSNKTLEEFRKGIHQDIQTASYDKVTEEGILQFIEDVISKKIEIKAHPSKNLHAKIYIFRPQGFCEHKAGSVITGSSNLTEAGLGTKSESNYEFNVLLHDYDDVKFATTEFESLWEEGVPVLPAEMQKTRDDTYLNHQLTPFELYIKFLTEYFGNSVEFDPSSIDDLPKGFMRLDYQVDAVAQGYDLLQRHNGFFLADVVGLGKTIIATLIAKKFFYHNGYPQHVTSTLVVTPPSLHENWEETFEKFGVKNYRIITNGSLHRIRNAARYDLIIVDEAHKFRTDTAESYNQLQKICKTDVPRRDGKGNIVKVRKKVILVSATPLNNSPEDIRNLVLLFQDSKDSTLEIPNLQRFFKLRIDEYKAAKKAKTTKQMLLDVQKIYELIRDKVVQPLTIRRTRTDLREHEQYKNDLDRQAITFPKVEKPTPIYYPLDDKLEQLYDRTMHLLQDPKEGLKYYRYMAISFLVPDKKAKYRNADLISTQLAKIMKTMLVKRIDSSFHAFTQSLKRFRDANEAMLRMFKNGRIIIAPKLNVSEFIMEGREDDLLCAVIEMQESDPTVEICEPSDFHSGFIDGLKHDQKILDELCKLWMEVEQDPKIDVFLDTLPSLLDQQINPERKLVIFSESSETTGYLEQQLKAEGYEGVLSIASGNRKELLPLAKANFDANAAKKEQANDYHILISTEVLAEGVNLHRSNIVINYDTPWNSTRLMQRIGRVNRIGSKAPAIYVYNFYPTARVNDDIELEKRAIMKLQAFHSALGEDSQIYSTQEEIGTFGLFDKVPEEERDERLDYLMELRKFKEEDPELFRKIKNLPLRCRVGRKDRIRSNSTLCFMRNKRRDAFYYIQPDGSIDSLSFVETARIFHAVMKEKALPLHDKHHDQIQAALKDFKDKATADASMDRLVEVAQGPNERKALAFLDMLLNFDICGEQDKRLITAAKLAIRYGKFQQLQRKVNKLIKDTKKVHISRVELLEKALAILTTFPLETESDDATVESLLTAKTDHFNPEIILSESFTDSNS